MHKELFICGKCKQEKKYSCFSKNKNKKHGINTVCRQCQKIYAKEHYKNNKPYYQELSKQYRQENRQQISSKQLKWYHEIKHDISHRILFTLRARLTQAVKKNNKGGSAVRDLGCSIPELKQWLEQQFYPNPKTGETMSWDNWGKYGWHIDHIVPLSSFDLSEPKQVRKACHWFNLRPLWAKENLSKGAHFE